MAAEISEDPFVYPDPMTQGPTDPIPAGGAVGEPHPVRSLNEGATRWGQKAVYRVDEKLASVACVLVGTAAGLRKGAERIPDGSKISAAVHAAACNLDRAANYIYDRRVRYEVENARQFITSHPKQSLIMAAALGFLVARAI
jgi:ElaB/YqjD/DUF883 family membrane-anchored ribosome-binding protein